MESQALEIPGGISTPEGPWQPKCRHGKFDSPFWPRPLDGVCYVLGNFVAVDFGIRTVGCSAGGRFKSSDEQAIAGRFAEVTCDWHRTRRRLIVLFLRRCRAGTLHFSKRRGFHRGDVI